MLPNHQPLVVAEQFLMLQALYPGRVDAGLGRSLGFTAPVRQALREDPEAADSFEDDLAELRAYLHGEAPITVRPQGTSPIPLFVLATGRGMSVAARLGLPVVVGGPILADDSLPATLATYRREFRPNSQVPQPRVVISLDVIVADTDAEARELALPEAWAMARARQTGEFPPLETIGSIRGQHWSSQLRSRVERSLDQATAGSPATVRRALERLVARTGADEILASTSTYDRDALLACDAALADLVVGA
jgi:luciferase family oxidoreductase group 1